MSPRELRRLLASLLTSILAAVLSSTWWGSRRTPEGKALSASTRSISTSATVCMAAALSESNPITVGDLEVQRIPCLSVSHHSAVCAPLSLLELQ